MNIFNTWQLNLFLYLISITAFFQFYKLAIKNTKNDGAATIMLQIIAGVFVLVLAPFFKIQFPSDPKIYLLLAVACIFYALNDRLQTTSRKHLDVSTFSIINQLLTVMLIFYGVIFFKEPLVLTKVLGALIIVCANILLFLKGKKLQLNKYVFIAFIAIAALAAAISIDIGVSKNFNLPFYIMLTLIIPSIFIKYAEKIPISHILEEFKSQSRKYYFATGIAWALTIFFSLRAFQLGDVSTIVPLQASSVLLNVIVAYILLKERDDRFKKLIAAILVVVGIYLTVL